MNLANIVKDLSLYTTGSGGPEGAKHPVVAAVEKLQEETSKEPMDKEEIQVAKDSSYILFVQGLSVPFACVGSGDPVRVLRLYTTNTLDIL